MADQFWCARCGQIYTLRPEMVGRQSRCRVCGLVQRVPEPLDAPAEANAYELAPEPTPPAPLPLPRPVEAPASSPEKERKRRPAGTVSLRAVFGEASHVQELTPCSSSSASPTC